MTADEVKCHLIAAARAGESLTYAELLERLGHRFSRPLMRRLCVLLGEVDAGRAARGEPELAVLVVRQSDRLPGQGWWIGAARDLGYAGPWEGPAARRFVAQRQRATFAWWASHHGPGMAHIGTSRADTAR